MSVKLNMAFETIKKLERKLSDARDAIIECREPPKLSEDKTRVLLEVDAYNKILTAINP